MEKLYTVSKNTSASHLNERRRKCWNADLIPGSGRSPGGGHGNQLQYSCLENPMDKGTGWATVHGFAMSQTGLKRFGRQAKVHSAKSHHNHQSLLNRD